MHIISVNRSSPVLLDGQRTGIFKSATHGAVSLNSLGLAGDSVCDIRHHGGPDQAVYVYGQIDYDWWETKLQRALAPGTFGDNLTIARLSCRELDVGDQLEMGDVVLEVSAPRIPCATFGKRMQDTSFPAQFRQAERPGFYCRVLNSGDVAAGMSVHLNKMHSERNGDRVSLLTLLRSHYQPSLAPTFMNTLLAAPIAIRERNRLLNLTKLA